MNKNKLILQYCPNFYRIINFEYFEDDRLSERLISIYQKFIFAVNVVDENEIKQAAEIDKVLAKYIDDYRFRKEMKQGLCEIKVPKTTENVLSAIVEGMINIFKKYEEGTTRQIYLSRWI